MSFEDDSKQIYTKTFMYIYKLISCDKECFLEIPVEIPYTRSVNELTHRIINSFHLPIYIEADLELKLKTFINDETISFQDSLAVTAIEDAKKSIIDVEDVIKKWEKTFKQFKNTILRRGNMMCNLQLPSTDPIDQGKVVKKKLHEENNTTVPKILSNNKKSNLNYAELTEKESEPEDDNIDPHYIPDSDEDNDSETVEYGEKRRTSDSEVFSNVYHKLVHSGPAFHTMLQVEQSYALAISQLLNQKDERISSLMAKQAQEMDTVIAGVDVHNTEQDVNKLLLKHVEELNLLQGRWNSEVDALKESQRREYREWLMKLLEEQETNTSPDSDSYLFPFAPPTQLKVLNISMQSDYIPALEESFTIHLGSQMKQMHNIRIMSGDILDFCKIKPTAAGPLVDASPHRLQTALGLYSNDLCGLVLLKDKDNVGSLYDLSKEFYSTCENSTEFHFPSIADQLESLKIDIKEALLWRQSDHQCGNLTLSERQSRRTNSKNLQPGDVFITRHSNLSNVHVMFHLIIDDTVKSNEINSRHAAILGLRNILKTACSNDITTLTIPVLLMHEITEEMTVAWCTKRVELVFKCVKGFMIEMATWGGSELKNLQFLVPKDISEEVFVSLATMLPSIFRVSNPLVFKASSSPATPKNKSGK